MSDFNMENYLSAFLDELDEQLQILDEEVLKLEQNSDDHQTIQTIFRAAHTLKGSSAAMGFEKLKELTHSIENVFDLIRLQQLKVTTETINVIFKSIDFIKVLKEGIIRGTIEEIEITPLVIELDQIKQAQNSKRKLEFSQIEERNDLDASINRNEDKPIVDVALEDYQIQQMRQAIDAGYKIVAVNVRLIEDAMLKSVRAFLVQNNLIEISEIMAIVPSQEIIEDDEQFDGNFTIMILTDSSPEEIIDIVNSVSEIDSVTITEITEKDFHEIIDLSVDEEAEFSSNAQNDIHIEDPDQKRETAKLKVQQTVRVDIERLEQLMNLVGELVIDQTRLADVRSRLADRYPNDDEIEKFSEVGSHLGQVISELQEGMMKTRMLPIEQLFNRFPRMVRDISQKAQKEIDFIIEGKETELDRNLIEEIGDPIIHLLRNSVDHGIEDADERQQQGKTRKGRVTLKAAHEENNIVITITDDGRGIDPEKVKTSAIKKGYVTEEEVERMTDKDIIFLIFKSGMSTASQITDISGRGVGMDIVRTHIEKLNGMIDIDSVMGQGTTFTIKLPLTLAIIRSLLVELGDKELAIPLANVQEIVRLQQDEIKSIKNQEVGIIRDRVLPLVRLHSRFDAGDEKYGQQTKKRIFIVVVGIAEKRVGLVVDRMIGNQDIVIKPLGKYIGKPKYIAGATIMGDGKVALILDIGTIVREEGTKELINQDTDNRKIEVKDDVIQLVTFKLSKEEYGIDIGRVKDIIMIPAISTVMNAPYSVIGMFHLRGELIPVMDLRQRFVIEQEELCKQSRIIVVEFAHTLVGILVDQVTQVIKVSSGSLESPPDNTSQVDAKFISSICNLNNRLIILLDLDLILDLNELKVLTDIVVEDSVLANE